MATKFTDAYLRSTALIYHEGKPNTNMTLWWPNEQFATSVYTLFSISIYTFPIAIRTQGEGQLVAIGVGLESRAVKHGLLQPFGLGPGLTEVGDTPQQLARHHPGLNVLHPGKRLKSHKQSLIR